MIERKIGVPDGMLKAAIEENKWRSPTEPYGMQCAIEAALRWISENPIVPTEQQALDMATGGKFDFFDNWELVRWGACEWQRRMFLAPEPEIPQAVKDVFLRTGIIDWSSAEVLRAVECYHLGQQSKGTA